MKDAGHVLSRTRGAPAPLEQAQEAAESLLSEDDKTSEYLIEIGGQRFEALAVQGNEGMSLTGKLEVTFRIPPNHGLDPNAVTGDVATLVIVRGQEDVRRIQRVVTQCVRGATKKGLAGTTTVLATLEPRLATLRYRVDIRVFRDKKAHQIANEVLAALGVTVEERLSGSYVVRPYTVQMRESDQNFAQRLLEDDGIGYFITDEDTVVFADAVASYDPVIGVLPFTSATGLERPVDSIFEVGVAGEVTPGKVSLRDFNFEHPSLNMDVSSPGPWTAGPEYYDYPGEYLEPAEGQVKANWRTEALACQASSLVARSYSLALRPGAQFVLANAPAGVPEGTFFIREVEHAWKREEKGVAVKIRAQSDSAVYRPPVASYIPRLLNPLSGFATGPAGEDIYTDKWGQAKVHFPWDRRQPKDENCSHWVPVLQDNTGHSVGIARIGWELLCHFLEGDPDRPVVVGRVFNMEDPFEETLPMHKTKTALRSLTSPRPKVKAQGGERNEILFEDAKGNEEIRMLAQKDQNVVAGNDKVEVIDNVEGTKVIGNEKIAIGEEHHADVKKNAIRTIAGDQTWTVAGSRKFEVKTSQSENIVENHTMTIGGTHFRRIGDSDTQQVEKTFKETIGGLVLEASVKTNQKTGSKLSAVTVGGAIIELAKMNKTEGSGKIRLETVGGIGFIKTGKEIATRVGKTRRTMVGAAMMVDALKHVAISGGEKLSTKSLTAKIDGSDILTLKVGETEVTLKDGVLTLKSKKDITFKADSDNKQAVGEARQI